LFQAFIAECVRYPGKSGVIIFDEGLEEQIQIIEQLIAQRVAQSAYAATILTRFNPYS